MEILEEMQSIRLNKFVFPGAQDERPMNDATLRVHLGRMDWDNLTVHGFRSSFRDWTAECTNFPREAAEMALAHAVGDAVERAYQRGDLFQKRRQLMNAWARYCSEPQSGKVVPLRRAG